MHQILLFCFFLGSYGTISTGLADASLFKVPDGRYSRETCDSTTHDKSDVVRGQF